MTVTRFPNTPTPAIVVLSYTDSVPTGLADGTVIVRKRAPFATETWTGTNGAAWPAGWTPEANSGTIDIQSNAGRIVTAASSYVTSRTYRAGLANGDLLVKLTLASTAEQYHFLWFRDDAAGNSYRCVVTPTDIGFQKSVSGSASYITSSSTITLSSAVPYWVRVAWSGSALNARVWAVGATEPGAWTNSTSDTTYTAAGSVGLGTSSGSSATAITSVWDDLLFQDLTP